VTARCGIAASASTIGRWPARRVLVHADREHPRVVEEGVLHPVPVVRVDIDVGRPVSTRGQQPADRDRRVVTGDPVDQAILATRKAVFPEHGLMPEL